MNQGQDSTQAVPDGELLRMTAEVVASYVRQNAVAADRLPELINAVHDSLKNVNGQTSAPLPEQPAKPAVAIRKSVNPDFLICLEDGKRHLRTTYNMSPDEYRTKWGLPPDYPMVAPNYAAQRSDFAKRIGLGRSARGGGRRRAG